MNEYMEPGNFNPQPMPLPADIQLYEWPVLSPTVAWVAFLLGLVLLIIGYFAGGHLGKGKIGMCILITSIIGYLSRGVLNYVLVFCVDVLSMSPHTAYVITSSVWMCFIASVAIMLYETFTITVEEAQRNVL